MELPGLTYRGAALDDIDILDRLPMDLQQLLAQRNGFVAFRGGLHVRGACKEPLWHSLRAAMEGPESFAERYRVVKAGDVPFAQTVFGDQFILRDKGVFRLDAYADTLEPLADDLTSFFFKVQEDPIAMLVDDATGRRRIDQ